MAKSAESFPKPDQELLAAANDSAIRAVREVLHYLLHRAERVLAWPPLSDEELLFLATGEISPG